MGWATGVRFTVGARNISLHHSVQTDAGAHQTSYQMDIGIFPGDKVAGEWS